MGADNALLTSDELFWLYVNNIKNMYAYRFSALYFKYGEKQKLIDAIACGEVPDYIENDARDDILSNAWLDKAKRLEEYMAGRNIRLILHDDRSFPNALREIPSPPALIYCIGDITATEGQCAAIIGSRVSTSYGRECAALFASELAKNGICTVSGMAEGIDGCAQRAAIKNGGRTVAVLGGGVDRIYPVVNRDLYDEICAHGAVISEYPLSSNPMRGNFPYRNRIISGLSKCLIVIEAGIKSGTMSTVDHALEQNKDVFALPGNITSPTSAGTNYLIKSGCTCVTSPEDILEVFGIYGRKRSLGPSIPDDGSFEKIHRDIISFLSIEPLAYEELEAKLKAEPTELNTALMMLEISGYINKNAGRIYELNRQGGNN